MSLNVEQIKIDNVTYECRELSMGEMLPLLESQTIGLELIKRAVFVDGEAIGDAIEAIGFKTGRILLREVNRLNGLIDEPEKS